MPLNSSHNINIECGNTNRWTLDNELRQYRIKNLHKVIIATLNVASLPNKFDQLKSTIGNNIDVLVLTETKLDDSFPSSQFILDGYSFPYRKDRDRHGGGILIYVREDITSKMLTKHTFPDDIEGIFVELNFKNIKWLLFGTYHPPSQSDKYYFDKLTNALDLYLNIYDKFVLTGDFNAQVTEVEIDTFLEQYDAKNLVKEPTCFKSVDNPSCIDLFLTNSPLSFQHT